jgi:hypothetical protein
MRRLLIAVMFLQTGTFAQGIGVTVSGRVTPAPGAVAASLNALRVVIVPSGYPPKTMEAVVSADGSFQFSKVPGGPYIVRLLPGTASTQSDTPNPAQAIFVGSQDISGIEMAGPQIITGRVVVEGGGALPLALGASDTFVQGRIEARAPVLLQQPQRGGPPFNGVRASDSESFRADGAFGLALFAGEYRVSLSGLPAGYTVRSISYGTTDLMQEPLKVVGSSSQEIRVTLRHAPGFSVRGRVTGLPAGSLPPGVAVMTPGASTRVNADGTFELRDVPAGSRAITLTRNGASYLSGQGVARSQLSTVNTTVVDRDIDGILLPWTPLTPISGNLVMLDKTGAVMAGVPPNAVVTLTSRDGKPIKGGCDTPDCHTDILTLFATPEGSLSENHRLVPPGESDVRIERLPPGYVVISLKSNGVDLLKEPLRITASTPSVDIQVVVQNTSGARMRGTVAASNMSPFFPQRVTLQATPGGPRGGGGGLPPAYQSAVAPDGAFEFSGIPAGTYSLVTNPDGSLAFGSTTSNIVVTDQDLDAVPIIGLSDAFVPNSIQAANEAAAFLNVTTVQRLQNSYNSSMQRYATIPDLVAAGLLNPSFSGTNSGYTLSVSATESDFVVSAIPVSAATGRYEFYFLHNGGSRALKITGSRDAGTAMDPVSGCGSDAPLCLRYGQTGGVAMPTLRGRVSIVDGPRGSSTLPAGLYVGAASTDGAGNLTALGNDGTFQVQLFAKPGEYRVVVQNLPAEYTIKSITSAGIEIPNGTFKTAAGGVSPGLFEIVLTSRPR